MDETVRAQIAAAGGQAPVVIMHDNFLEPGQAACRSTCKETALLVRSLVGDDHRCFAPLARGLDAALGDYPRRHAE